MQKLLLPLWILLFTLPMQGQTLYQTERNKFAISGYLRTGTGRSQGGATQAHFQVPGALNKFSLGNQADTYGELEFDYTYYLNEAQTKSIDAVWMVSVYEAFGSENQMEYNPTEQLYLRANNLLGGGESLWVGNRFYNRQAIHQLDRQWINPGQKGWGGGVEHLLQSESEEDVMLALFTFRDKDVTSYLNQKQSTLHTYTLDARWVKYPLTESWSLSAALNYSRRIANKTLAYEGKSGFGLFAWADYLKGHITHTSALLFRQGANIPVHHWTGLSERENPANDSLVLNNLSRAYSLEINNNFLYDNLETFALNATLTYVLRNHGTAPYYWVDNTPQYIEGRGELFQWLALGVRGMYYLNNHFKLALELTHEYVDNQQLGVAGHLDKITLSPELSLTKGFYARPVVRPFITYAFWSNSLRGYVGDIPQGAPYGDKTAGFTYGIQFEIWW